MTLLYDIGQQVKIRDCNWEIYEIIEKNNVQTLKVQGIDDNNIGQSHTFLDLNSKLWFFIITIKYKEINKDN